MNGDNVFHFGLRIHLNVYIQVRETAAKSLDKKVTEIKPDMVQQDSVLYHITHMNQAFMVGNFHNYIIFNMWPCSSDFNHRNYFVLRIVVRETNPWANKDSDEPVGQPEQDSSNLDM